MNPSALFIRRPIATVLLTAALALIGVAAYFVLPVAPLPQVDFPTIVVRASLPGASPEVMATSVATPLERTLGSIADLTEITSQSSQRNGQGSAQIVLQFGLDRNIDGAARDVQSGINAAEALLPSTLTSRPTYDKANPADPPIMILALTSPTLANFQVYDAASVVIQQALSQIAGVGEVDVFGAASPAVRVEMNPFALNKYQIGLEDVKAALQSTNAFTPKGSVVEGGRRLQIYTNDQATQAKDYKDVIVAYRNGAPVRIRDIAQVVDGPENLQNLGLSNGRPAIVVEVNKSPGANVIATADHIRQILPQLRADIDERGPIDLRVVLDKTTTIRAALKDVEQSLLISIVLVVVVVLVFLRNGRATLIPGVAVTVSLLGTLGVMFLCHYTLDNLSLMALTVATGFVVDDAIVVLENISRHVEEGVPRFQAALQGAGEVGFTVMSISISLIAVFIPILAMGGIVGRLFREFAVTLSAAIVISLFVSLTATPMMAARLIDDRQGEDAKTRRRSHWQRFWGRASDGFEWGFGRATRAYEHSLAWALDNSLLVLMVLFATIGLTVYLYAIVPKGFFPQEDTGLLVGGVQVDQASSFELTAAKFRRLQAIVQRDPAVDTVTSFTQSAGGFMFISLKPRAQRPGVTADMVLNRLRPKTFAVRGANLFLQSAQDIRVGGRQSNAAYQYTLTSDNLTELRTWSDKLMRALQAYPDLTDVNTDQQYHALETFITIDRATASRLGITPQQVDNVLNDAFGQSFASIIYNPLNQYHVVMEVAQQYQRDPAALANVYVGAPSFAAASGVTTVSATSGATSSGGGSGGVSSSSSANGPSTGAGGVSGSSSSSNTGVASASATGSGASGTVGSSTGTTGGGGGQAVGVASSSSPSSFSSTGSSSAFGGSGSTAGRTGASTAGNAAIAGSGSTGAASTFAGAAGSSASTTLGGSSASSTFSSSSTASGSTFATGSSLQLSAAGSGGGSGAAASTTKSATATGTTLQGAGTARASTGGAVATSSGVAISTSPETVVPLSAIARWALGSTPLSVNHQSGAVAATLSFNTAPGKSLSDAQRDIAEAIVKIGMPITVVGSFQGTAQAFAQSLATEPLLIAAALLSVYIVLGVLYESYVHPLTVLSTLPSAGVGAVLALLIFHVEFSIIALIGVILLIGIVKKNAIMIIDFALVAEREQGLSSRDAIYQACMLRFRPILMTTCAAIMGAVPLAVGFGDGGELRRPLGISIIGGLIASQVLTLLTTPVVYLYLDRLRRPGPRRVPRGLGGGVAPAPLPAE